MANPVVASVITDDALRIEEFDELNPIVAPFTKALEASNARTVMVIAEVPSAVNVNGVGAVNNKLAIAGVELEPDGVDVTGALPWPPPPPHAVKTTASTRPIVVLKIDIINALFIP